MMPPMKHVSMLLAVLVAGLVFTGCASTPTRVSTGKIKAKTFTYVDLKGRPTPEFAEKRAPVHAMIQAAIDAGLAAKGLAKVDENADVYVAYLLIVNNNTSTASVNDYFGHGRDSSGLVEKAHEKLTIESKDPNAFEEGTLVIDLIDGRTHELIWRNFVIRGLHRDATDEVRQQRINDAVAEALTTLRVAK